MGELTPAELTVLGLVAEAPRHGYELEQVIEQRNIRSWTDIGFSSIYYLLDKLEKKGFVESQASEGRGKARRVFAVTDEGRQVAAAAAAGFVAGAHVAPQPMLVGLTNLDLLTPEAYDEALRERLAIVKERIVGLEQQQTIRSLPRSAQEVLSYSLAMLEAERAWLAERAANE